MRRAVVLTALAVVAAAAAAFAPLTSAQGYTESTYTARLVALLNQARADHGLRALTVASGTTTVAAGWTQQLAASRQLSHNPDLRHQLETHGSPDWTTYGENVGDGPSGDPDGLFKAYMSSPEHRDNILLGAYRYVGVATVFTGGTAWNTFDFVDSYAATRHHRATAAVAPTPSASPAATAAPTRSPRTRPVTPAATHAPRPAAAAAAPAPTRTRTEPTRSARPQPHHPQQKTHRTHVRGLRLHAAAGGSGVVAEPSLAAAAAPLSVPGPRRAVVVAVAVLAAVAAARRWTLVTAGLG